MVRVVFVAPFAADTTLRFVRCAAELPDVRMAVITQDDPEKLPEPLRARLVAVRRVGNALDAGELASAVRALEAQLGGPAERLIGVLEQLQVPLAEVREQLRIRGMDAQEARNFRDKSRMKDVLRAHGLPCAQHRLCPTETEALEFAARAGFPLVAKPPAGASRLGINPSSRGSSRTTNPSSKKNAMTPNADAQRVDLEARHDAARGVDRL